MERDATILAAEAAKRIVERLERVRRYLELDDIRREANAEVLLRRHRGELTPEAWEPGLIAPSDVLSGRDLLEWDADLELVSPHILPDEDRAIRIAVELQRRHKDEFGRLMVKIVSDSKWGLPSAEQQRAMRCGPLREVVQYVHDMKKGDLRWKLMLQTWRGIAERLDAAATTASGPGSKQEPKFLPLETEILNVLDGQALSVEILATKVCGGENYKFYKKPWRYLFTAPRRAPAPVLSRSAPG